MNYHYIRQAQYKKGFISPLLLALIAVILIGGGAYVYVQATKQGTPPVTPTTQTTSTAQTSEWKIYTNSEPNSCLRINTKELGFVYIHNTDAFEKYSISYPADAQITEESGLDVPCALDLSKATSYKSGNLTISYGIDSNENTSSASLDSAKAIVATLKLQ